MQQSVGLVSGSLGLGMGSAGAEEPGALESGAGIGTDAGVQG